MAVPKLPPVPIRLPKRQTIRPTGPGLFERFWEKAKPKEKDS